MDYRRRYLQLLRFPAGGPPGGLPRNFLRFKSDIPGRELTGEAIFFSALLRLRGRGGRFVKRRRLSRWFRGRPAAEFYGEVARDPRGAYYVADRATTGLPRGPLGRRSGFPLWGRIHDVDTFLLGSPVPRPYDSMYPPEFVVEGGAVHPTPRGPAAAVESRWLQGKNFFPAVEPRPWHTNHADNVALDIKRCRRLDWFLGAPLHTPDRRPRGPGRRPRCMERYLLWSSL